MLSKACKSCGNVYPLDDFPIKKNYKDGRHYLCFPCKREVYQSYQATYVAKDPERKRRNGRNWARRNASTQAVQARIYKYGLTPEAVAEMVEAQGGVCGLCSREFSNGETFVDHDHTCCPAAKTCGKCVRGILCRACNQGMGLLQDDPALLRAAADYIERYR